MKQINITKNQITLVDDQDYDYLSQYKWHAQWNKYTRSYYAVRNEGRTAILMHREILNTPSHLLCDHEDHNTLNNQRYNLRNATQSQNQMNRKLNINNTLGEKCISKSGTGFRVQIEKDGKFVFRKSYRNLSDAISARDEEIQKHHGEFAFISSK